MPTHVSHQSVVIASVSGAGPRPLWSVMIPTYNCARFLRDALASVLRQDMGPDLMQIEVVDDCSMKDDPFAVVRELGQGRVDFFRQTQNQGVPGNLNCCLQRARGRLLHVLHGDDMVRDNFYLRMSNAFHQHPEIGAAFCRHIFIDEAGRWLSSSPLERCPSVILEDSVSRLATEQRIMTPSMVVRREVYEHLGGFDQRLICSEDWEMWVRIATRYPIAYETEPLAAYRMHDDSNTGRHVRTGEDMRYTRKAISIFESYLPADLAPSVVARARATYAMAALRNADSVLRRKDIIGAVAQLSEALKLCASSRAILEILRLAVQNLGL